MIKAVVFARGINPEAILPTTATLAPFRLVSPAGDTPSHCVRPVVVFEKTTQGLNAANVTVVGKIFKK